MSLKKQLTNQSACSAFPQRSSPRCTSWQSLDLACCQSPPFSRTRKCLRDRSGGKGSGIRKMRLVTRNSMTSRVSEDKKWETEKFSRIKYNSLLIFSLMLYSASTIRTILQRLIWSWEKFGMLRCGLLRREKRLGWTASHSYSTNYSSVATHQAGELWRPVTITSA